VGAICERAALFREALASAVTSRGHEVECCVSTLADAVRAVERCSVDVLLLDASLSEGESLARLRQELGLRVLILTGSGGDVPAAEALEAGLADAVLDHAVALVTLERAVNGLAQHGALPRPPPSIVEEWRAAQSAPGSPCCP
jgi:DNA-binding response OmpR family regulator